MKHLVLCMALGGLLTSPAYAQGKNPLTFLDHCFDTYEHHGQCPENICELKCEDVEGNETCASQVCVPVSCPQINVEYCPEDFCQKMINCSEEEICNHPMLGEKAECGDLAYAGQDVDCCPGFVQRCGIEFIDGSCDMEGRGSVYALPICIPCGDGVCGQFENPCNCPEDCAR